MHEGKQHGLSDLTDNELEGVSLVILPDAGSNDYKYHNIHGLFVLVYVLELIYDYMQEILLVVIGHNSSYIHLPGLI